MTGFNRYLNGPDKIQCLFCLSNKAPHNEEGKWKCPDCGRAALVNSDELIDQEDLNKLIAIKSNFYKKDLPSQDQSNF